MTTENRSSETIGTKDKGVLKSIRRLSRVMSRRSHSGETRKSNKKKEDTDEEVVTHENPIVLFEVEDTFLKSQRIEKGHERKASMSAQLSDENGKESFEPSSIFSSKTSPATFAGQRTQDEIFDYSKRQTGRRPLLQSMNSRTERHEPMLIPGPQHEQQATSQSTTKPEWVSTVRNKDDAVLAKTRDQDKSQLRHEIVSRRHERFRSSTGSQIEKAASPNLSIVSAKEPPEKTLESAEADGETGSKEVSEASERPQSLFHSKSRKELLHAIRTLTCIGDTEMFWKAEVGTVQTLQKPVEEEIDRLNIISKFSPRAFDSDQRVATVLEQFKKLFYNLTVEVNGNLITKFRTFAEEISKLRKTLSTVSRVYQHRSQLSEKEFSDLSPKLYKKTDQLLQFHKVISNAWRARFKELAHNYNSSKRFHRKAMNAYINFYNWHCAFNLQPEEIELFHKKQGAWYFQKSSRALFKYDYPTLLEDNLEDACRSLRLLLAMRKEVMAI
uniref:Uncharacterized protein n=1 Tax=Candidozyma auris TaxID=498019 RepID=A0A0L0NZL3_CANAR